MSRTTWSRYLRTCVFSSSFFSQSLFSSAKCHFPVICFKSFFLLVPSQLHQCSWPPRVSSLDYCVTPWTPITVPTCPKHLPCNCEVFDCCVLKSVIVFRYRRCIAVDISIHHWMLSCRKLGESSLIRDWSLHCRTDALKSLRAPSLVSVNCLHCPGPNGATQGFICNDHDVNCWSSQSTCLLSTSSRACLRLVCALLLGFTCTCSTKSTPF